MSRLIYSMLTSLDGYVVDADGDFAWAEPDEEVHRFVNESTASVGTHLYGRRMHETMVYWETAHTQPDQPPYVLEWARAWQAAAKVVYSTTLAEPSSARTRIEREFGSDAVRDLVAGLDNDVTVAGPHLAAHAVRAAIVDEYHLLVAPVVAGGGTRFLPDDVRVDLELVDERFGNGTVHLRYRTRRGS